MSQEKEYFTRYFLKHNMCALSYTVFPFSMMIVKTLPLLILAARHRQEHAKPGAILNVPRPLREADETTERKEGNHTTGDTAAMTDLDVRQGRGEGGGARGRSGGIGEGAQDGK